MYSITYNISLIAILVVAIIALPLLAIGTTSLPTFVLAQSNNSNPQSSDEIDYTGFHSNVEQILGHIEKALFNKINNNETNTLGHALHPIEEVLSLVTIPLTNADANLNKTYFDNLYILSGLANHGNSTIDQFKNQSDSSIDLSKKVISAVVPPTVLGTAEHNASVIRDLLTVSAAEYTEGVADAKIIMELEYQDGSAFIDRAYALFNNTQNILNDTAVVSQLQTGFSNLTSSVQNLEDPAFINQIVENINGKLAPSNKTSSAIDATVTTEKSSEEYVTTIRGLLNEIITAYESNDMLKAKELATTAYLDNFEFIETPIGKELSDRGEALLREKLPEQIDVNASLDEIKQTIADINTVLDESISVLNST
ncbi:MAG TPA: hypothetical protein VFT71_04130 [Candidatus Nitrosocosmicus sp.]|nr:hypothetical protein [Candidatus Nitrosocosmicus sp.]